MRYTGVMAIKTVQIVQDDIDGSDGASTVMFALDGSSFEIDLNDAHAEELRQAMQPWIEKARRTRGGRASARRSMAAASSSPLRGRHTAITEKGLSAKEVREWAQANGVEVSEYGRIADSVIEKYEAAQKAPAVSEAESAPARKTAPRKRATAKRGGRKPATASAES